VTSMLNVNGLRGQKITAGNPALARHALGMWRALALGHRL
jgi:hypothetical protein